jgi:hypothetical protein
MDSCDLLVTCIVLYLSNLNYLHGAAQPEDTVVGLLWLEALKCGLDNVVLFGEQVVGPVRQSALAHAPIYQIFLVISPSSIYPAASKGAYLSPSCLYPAALQYQLASGFIQRCSHGRLLMKGASDGADMVAVVRRGVRCRRCGSRQWQGVSGGGEVVRVSLSVRRKV